MTTTTADKGEQECREAFEREYQHCPILLKRFGNGYSDADVDAHWIIYQGAWASIVRHLSSKQAASVQVAEDESAAETAWSIAGRLALELECLLLDTKDTAIVSKWWDTAHEALEDYRLVRNAAPCDCGQFIFDRCQALKEKNPNIVCKADIQFRYKSPSSPKDCTK